MKQLKLEGEDLNQILQEVKVWHHQCSKEKGSSVKKHYNMNDDYAVTLTSAKLSGKILKATLNRAGIYLDNIKVERPKVKLVDKPKQSNGTK